MANAGFKSNLLHYTLIAQTPLIHFQPDQAGATLRATEVKPKLDKFLWRAAQKDGLDPRQLGWCPPSSDTLCYKVRLRVCSAEKDPSLKIANFKFYFGNIGNGVKKDFVFHDVAMTVVCANDTLRAWIDKHVKAFFAVTNFGARQSKGFGGFLVQGTTEAEIDRALSDIGTLNFGFAISPSERLFGTFVKAQAVYAVMKSGINAAHFTPFNQEHRFAPTEGQYLNQKGYIKSFAQRAFLGDSIGSDKAFIKARVLRPIRTVEPAEQNDPLLGPRSKENFESYSSYVFIRALLGLADRFEFNDDIHCRLKEIKTDRANRPLAVYIKEPVFILHYAGITVENGKCLVDPAEIQKDGGIKRFKSPITIKMLPNRVLFLMDNSCEQMLGQTFLLLNRRERTELTHQIASNNYQAAAATLQNAAYIQTPQTFDRHDFITRFVEYFNEVKHKLADCHVKGFEQTALVYYSEEGAHVGQ